MMAWECRMCVITETWSTKDAAQAAAVWHAYHAHPVAFAAAVEHDGPPRDPLPEMLGRQLAPWEISR